MRQKEEVGRVVAYILAKGVGAYPGEGAYQSVGAYSRKYGTCSSEPFHFPDDSRWLCFKETNEKCGS